MRGKPDGERHPTAALAAAEETVRAAAVAALAADLDISTEEATTTFDALSLHEQRGIARRFLTAVVEPRPGKTVGRLIVSPRG